MDIVTGGFGFIGNELVRQLKNSGKEVVILDNRNRVAPRIGDIADVPVLDCDITDHVRVSQLLRENKPERVFHLAAIHYIPECNDNPERTIQVNVEGTLGLLRAAAKCNVSHFIFASSGAVYADSPDPLPETFSTQPVDIYGWSKRMAEQLCSWHNATEGLPITACRFFNNYGPRETNAHIIPEIIEQLRKGDVLQLGTISSIRDYIHTADTAKAMRLLGDISSDTYRAVNVSGGQSASVSELIAMMGEILRRDIRIETDATRFRKADKHSQTADISQLRSLTGWTPTRSLRDGLTDLLQFEGLLD